MQIANYANSRLTRNKKVKDQIVSKLESDLQYVIIFKSLNTSNNIYNIGFCLNYVIPKFYHHQDVISIRHFIIIHFLYFDCKITQSAQHNLAYGTFAFLFLLRKT